MKILITCGHPYSGLQNAFDVLVQAGLALPQLSRRELLSPADLHEKIFATRNLDLKETGLDAPLSPGKIWQILAADLFMGNIGQTDWGWADARSVWLLDFWKKLDAQICFVLMYSSPEFAVGKMVRDKLAKPGDFEEIISSWMAYNSEILRFYNRNSENSLLVNISTLIHNVPLFIEKLNETFGTTLNSSACQVPSEQWEGTAIAATLAKTLTENHEEAHALLCELESTADLADHNSLASDAEKYRALAEYSELLARIDDAGAEIQELAEHARRQKNEQGQLADTLQLQIKQRIQLQSEFDCLKHDHAALQILLEEFHSQKTDYPSDLAQENELLLVQLHHVQEEFEHYYLKWKELSATIDQAIKEHAFLDRFWNRHPPSEILIDFRDEFDGDNWYYAESDGRWAGPGNVSTIQLPSLRKGRYEFYLEVVDAMDREIVTGMVVSLNGGVLQTKVEGRRKYPVMVSAEFFVEDTQLHPVWQFQFTFPKVTSPVERGARDQRSLAIRVRTLKLRRAA